MDFEQAISTKVSQRLRVKPSFGNARYGYEQRNIVQIKVCICHCADLHLLVAGNDALANLNIQCLNFHEYLPYMTKKQDALLFNTKLVH